VSGPAGFGKTTAVAQWFDTQDRQTVWWTVDRDGSLPASLLPESLREMETSSKRGLLVIDDAGRRVGGRSMAMALLDLIDAAETAQVVIITRSTRHLPIARWRTEGRVVEITASDLAMDRGEAMRLFAEHGLTVDPMLDVLIERSEGWPAVLSLAALGSRISPGSTKEDREARYVTEYIHEEVISTLSPKQREFLTATSILDQLNGALCDAVAGREGSGRFLRRIAEETQLLQPIDIDGLTYRMNPLLREALRSHAERGNADELRHTHDRAAIWYEEHGELERSIQHARAAGDIETFTRILGRLIRDDYVRGRSTRVLEWMSWLEAEVPIGEHPDVAAVGALIHGLEGRGLDMERWLADARNVQPEPHPLVHYVDALRTLHGTDAMIADAQKARRELPPGSVWIPSTFLCEGMAHIWNDDPDPADPLLAEAISLASSSTAVLTTTVALADRASIAIGRGRWDDAEALIARSMGEIEANSLETYSTSGLTLAMAARIALHHGDIANARQIMDRTASLRGKLSSTFPGLSGQTLIEMAGVRLELSDAVGARTLAREARDIISQRADLGRLPDRLQRLEQALSHHGLGAVGPSALTKAELRLLPMLATHLTFPEIGDRLYISRHTVKSQAMAIYRKLGTSSRSEAIARARDSGLLRD
jgi:LuxR family maltose regulon positive regulatory protein